MSSQNAPNVAPPWPVTSKTRWVPYGESVEIHRLGIPGGLLYFGSTLSRVSGYGVEPALIDPRLPVQSFGTGEDMPYWPSYAEISPASRGAYLRWLAGGRRDPNANLGLVFLFFYGLERRAITEQQHVSEEEWEQIRSEVARLIGIYGQRSSFQTYAQSFLGVLGSTRIDGDKLAIQVPEVTKSWESPNLPLRVGLGWMAKNGRPIPANWALAWACSHDAFSQRTPAARCRAQFERLFSLRYREHFGDGVIVKPNKTHIRASYKPASASFGGEVNLSIPELPDITVLKQPVERLVLLANQCTDELDPYSRYLGRNPSSGESAAALTLLPAKLVHASGHPAFERIVGWIQGLSSTTGLTVTSYRELRGIWPSLPELEITRRDAVMLSQCLARLAYGMEPDIRFGSHLVKADGAIVIFPLPADAPSAPSAPYTSATLLAHLGASIAFADNQVTAEEEQALMSHVAQSLELAPPEKLRLQAYTKWLLLNPPETTGLKKRIEAVPQPSRTLLGAFLARLVGLDGSIAPSEISALQKIYRQLGLDPQAVFADTHSAATEPISVQKAEPPPAFGIPTPAVHFPRSRVDLARVRAMEIESDRVSVLLREIFTVEEEGGTTVSTVAESAVVVSFRVLDLDNEHSQFALSIIEREEWSRSELDTVAARHGLMPDGAIDAINEAALNIHGDLLLEGDDPVEVNQQLRSLIKS